MISKKNIWSKDFLLVKKDEKEKPKFRNAVTTICSFF